MAAAANNKQMDVSIFHRETIKPSSPTPPHLRTFKLSVFDLQTPPVHTPLLIFYSGGGGGGGSRVPWELNFEERCQRLKRSLSETLTRFYPLAGRLSPDLRVIDCNDEGAPYSQARANVSMSSVLERPQHEELDRFVQTGLFVNPEAALDSTPLVCVQATSFECGGMVIGLSISHSIVDAASYHMFLNFWSKAASGDLVNAVVPDFDAATRFQSHYSSPRHPFIADFKPRNYISRRFVFDALKVKTLKAMAASGTVHHPTRTEVVSALIWKCSMKAAAAAAARLKQQQQQASSSRGRSSFLSRAVNMRSRVTPPVPSSSIGNIRLLLGAQRSEEEEEAAIILPDLVCQLREKLQEFTANSLRRVRGLESVSAVVGFFDDFKRELAEAAGNNADWYFHSSCCGFGFYETDFGWGKPTWLVFPLHIPNFTTFLDTPDGGGVEAWVNLVEDEMSFLENDPELLKFASVNPSPLQQKRTNIPSAL